MTTPPTKRKRGSSIEVEGLTKKEGVLKKEGLTKKEVVETEEELNNGSVSQRPVPDSCAKIVAALQAIRLDIHKFTFEDSRMRHLRGKLKATVRGAAKSGVLYYMHRDQRVQDNWAFVYSQITAIKHKVPLYVVAGISVSWPESPEATRRALHFSLGGLKEVSRECAELDIHFELLRNHEQTMAERVATFAKNMEIGIVVVDFSPLKPHRTIVAELVSSPDMEDVSIYQVDAHNVVPLWVTSDKQEYAAKTIRPKINKHLPKYLTEFPNISRHPYPPKQEPPQFDWEKYANELKVDETVQPTTWATPGTRYGLLELESFVKTRLKYYSDGRNDPNKKAQSELSPWLHYGQISAQRAVLFVRKFGSHFLTSVSSFIEEAVIRSELADNYCYYQTNYNNLMGASEWARETLDTHSADKREYIYTREQLENAETHDHLWNASQIQLQQNGKLHGYLRMYWAKKILEWTPSPEIALETALYLNDHYSLDGADSNGFVGCMWSIGGVHDMGWAERPIFGKIRYMNYKGCTRKFDVDEFVRTYPPPKMKEQGLFKFAKN